MDLISPDWKHLLKTETFQMKNLIQGTIPIPIKVRKKVKYFQKTSTNKEIHFTLQSNSNK